MQQNPSPPPPGFPEIPPTTTLNPNDDLAFDWSDFLDFNLDETVTISFPPPPQDQSQQLPDETGPINYTGRPRKRDPRLTCPNFLAGRVPCACPELDAQLEEEEERAARGGPVAKRVRVSGGGPTRCQVPGCEVDISELKGYHKRHRVCLGCANAVSVVLDGEDRRYCQQCGKFHLLPDFDEGKRSCRRKLERHNNRRRRKPQNSKGGVEKEAEQSILGDDASGDDDPGKDGGYLSSQIENEEREILSESDGHRSTLYSAIASENLQGHGVASFAASGIIQSEKQIPAYNSTTSYDEKKSSFSSICPAGRISFKLYDWNPAEFPRRLRHQIFQWLSSMPIELEGYIRPGCTILTAFIAMPTPMWVKLLDQPALSIKELIASPGSMLAGRGSMLVYLNDMIFRVPKDATSVVKLKVKAQAPKLHYIYPTCFEAGRPMEFVACGSDLLQPKFRFLVSFSGSYLPYNICVSSASCSNTETNGLDHQLVKISIPQTDVDLCGPAFVEVENQSGLSNFIPILISDREACVEMDRLLQKFDTRFSSQEQPLPSLSHGCEYFALRQAQFSDFVRDVAWSLRKPVQESQLTSTKVQKYNSLLNFLVEKQSSVILKRLLCSLKSSMDKNAISDVSDADRGLLLKNMDIAKNMLDQKSREEELTMAPSMHGNVHSHNRFSDDQSVVPDTNNSMQSAAKNLLRTHIYSHSPDTNPLVPLLNNEVVMNVNIQDQPLKPRHLFLTRSFTTSRPLLIAITALCACFGVCAVAFHPIRVSQIATTIRRCLFDES